MTLLSWAYLPEAWQRYVLASHTIYLAAVVHSVWP
jgi:hypothetical protein